MRLKVHYIPNMRHPLVFILQNTIQYKLQKHIYKALYVVLRVQRHLADSYETHSDKCFLKTFPADVQWT